MKNDPGAQRISVENGPLTFLSGVVLRVVLMLLDNAFLLSAVSAILDDQHSLRAPHETVNP